MNPARAIDQLHKLAELLDRARDDARSEAHDLGALLDEAARMLDAIGPGLTASDTTARRALADAARRARASQAALERTLREELVRVGRQIGDLPAPATGARYGAASNSEAHLLDKVG